ncbi:MAG: Signal peptidase peptidase, partial [Patescibacteria group bacterium]|nr:Signal peptidase peptidase [Patescibacteria group bacterium]
AASSDSRYWGNLNKSYIVGKALIRLLPAETFEIHPGFYNYELTQEE